MDPVWAVEETLSEAKVWEMRAREQMARARYAEAQVKELADKVNKLERGVALACGETPETAAAAFAATQWPGDLVTDVGHASFGPNGFRVRCHVDGTSMKIDGKEIPGGFIVTSWI